MTELLPGKASVVLGAAHAIPPQARAQWVDLARAIAAARGVPCESDPEAWWPAKGSASAAIEGCNACQARSACLDYAMAADEREGIWGGLAPAERQELLRTTAA